MEGILPREQFVKHCFLPTYFIMFLLLILLLLLLLFNIMLYFNTVKIFCIKKNHVHITCSPYSYNTLPIFCYPYNTPFMFEHHAKWLVKFERAHQNNSFFNSTVYVTFRFFITKSRSSYSTSTVRKLVFCFYKAH